MPKTKTGGLANYQRPAGTYARPDPLGTLPVLHLQVFALVERSQHPSHDLAGSRGWYAVHKLNLARNLIGGKRATAELNDLAICMVLAILIHASLGGERQLFSQQGLERWR